MLFTTETQCVIIYHNVQRVRRCLGTNNFNINHIAVPTDNDTLVQTLHRNGWNI